MITLRPIFPSTQVIFNALAKRYMYMYTTLT